MMIIDAKDMVVGRIATRIAKAALAGEKVDVINCEKAIMTGNKEEVFARYKKRRNLGTHATGPFYCRQPDRFVRRIIRGMLPYRISRGSEAFKRVMCHTGCPEELEGKEVVRFDDAHISKLPTNRYVTVNDICRFMGAKI